MLVDRLTRTGGRLGTNASGIRSHQPPSQPPVFAVGAYHAPPCRPNAGISTLPRLTPSVGCCSRTVRVRVAQQDLRSEAERFVQELASGEGEAEMRVGDQPELEPSQLRAQLERIQEQVDEVQTRIDALFRGMFDGAALASLDPPREFPDGLSEAAFALLGREEPEVVQALVTAAERADGAAWLEFQGAAAGLKLQRGRLQREAGEMAAALEAAEKVLRAAAAYDEYREVSQAAEAEGSGSAGSGGGSKPVRMVMITGFESFNVDLYKKVSVALSRRYPGTSLRVFSDRDIAVRRGEVEAALQGADVFFGSLLFDFDDVEWLRARIAAIPTRLVFESALELMGCTQIGTFQMAPSGKRAGPPPAVKKLLSMFGSGREEDRMVGYLSMLKLGPKLLGFVPGQKARDLRNWLTVYGYWNQGGLENCVNMFVHLLGAYFSPALAAQVGPLQETPATGCLHPDADALFSTPQEYMSWYAQHGAVQDPDAPTAAILLYRKHVITGQPYIADLVREMEAQGVQPLPIFINGVEAHTIVRDQLTSLHEQTRLRAGQGANPSLRRDAVAVDAVVNTIGFPLVGGPAGTMEGGRQADVAKAILAAKNVPYIVAAPLLIQDLASWSRDGVAGLQSVVLYGLPELDGAIDTVPLGGLCGDNIFLVPERVRRLAQRVRRWHALRTTPAKERKLALLLYGFPPGVGATGTAALLNVPRSLEALLSKLAGAGYDLGDAYGPAAAAGKVDGEALVAALQAMEEARTVAQGERGVAALGAGAAAEFGAQAVAREVTPRELQSMLTYPREWGPTEWGPIPFLPENDILVQKMEAQWGELSRYRGIMTTSTGNTLVSGLQLGNVWIGVQPALGVEGDPLRMLFQRDLTPHPQYAAFYKWLQDDFCADAVLHFGMHGTVEWLPGAPLGNSGFSWSDVLLGNMPNVYVYAANNPSESIVAKRRGYGTIVSHNVPPYGRAGLYKALAEARALIAEYREDPGGNAALRAPIASCLNAAGLQNDCPFMPAGAPEPLLLTPDNVESLSQHEFDAYASQMYAYLGTLENRLFSEGLHVLGAPPSPGQVAQFLSAYFGEALPQGAVDAVARAGDGDDVAALRQRLERLYAQEEASISAAGARGVGDAAVPGFGSQAVGFGERVEEAARIKALLAQNTQELDGVLAALNGEYVLPEAGGDLLRDGPGVLPTGRNIHALDPYRMPSPAALQRGAAAAEAILQQHRAANGGAWPETVSINLWGLDAIKTKGESVAMVLHCVGAAPVAEGTGRIARFELLPLEQLGRPRVDVLCNMSGIFRDSFQNVVELLDDMFLRAASAEGESWEENYVRKHAAAFSAQGLANGAARLFSNPAGDYGSMVNERVGASNWEDGAELGDTWVSRNAFSYGKRGERGTPRPELLRALLATTERVVQQVDSVEYGLTDIQEYYANTGALKKAAETARGGAAVGCSVVEAFSADGAPRELDEVLRLEYRSKLLNPKWAEAMAAQGSGGAYEISQRMTAAIGWGATAGFAEDWVWDGAAATYAFDDAMAERLRRANPQAFSNMLKRLLEAAGRGMWRADDAALERLRGMYNDVDSQLEGVNVQQ